MAVIISLREYVDEMSKVENDIVSFMRYGTQIVDEYGDEWSAQFWHDGESYKLVLSPYKRDKFWGDEELIDVNDIKLTADELYNILVALPGAEVGNFYGMRRVFNNFPTTDD